MRKTVFATVAAALLFAGILFLLFVRQAPGERARIREAGANGADGTAGQASHSVAPEKPGLVEQPAKGEKPAQERAATPAAARVLTEGPMPLARGDASILFELERSLGGPLTGGAVTLLRGRKAQSVTTGADGMASFDGIEAGVYSFRIAAPGLPELAGAKELTLARRQAKRLSIVVGDYSLSIAGRVLDRSGVPVEGITVRARRRLEALKEGDIVREDQTLLEAPSAPDGRFEFAGVDASEYLMRTEAAKGFAPAEKVTRGGSRSVEFVLAAARVLEVHGKVLTRSGAPVPSAHVEAPGQGPGVIESEADGRYTVEVNIGTDQAACVLLAKKDGYREARVNVRLDDIGDAASWELDLVLDELGARGTLTGFVGDLDRSPVAGEAILIHSGSLGARYDAVSDAAGRFAIEGVQVGGDYRLSIFPRRGFKDFAKGPIEVTQEGADVEILLERLEMGSVNGVLVDAAGAAIPGFSLWVHSLKAQGNKVAFTSNSSGAFEALNVPEGELVFETHSEPQLTVRGLVFEPSSTSEMRVVLDWGSHEVSGVVVDEGGAPVPGASASMRWEQNAAGQQTASFRTAVTDAQGRFTFSELGTGPRKVTVTSPRHVPALATVDPASGSAGLTIELKPRPERPVSPGR